MNPVGRNVFLSTVANLANQVVRTAQQFVWVPLFLSAFGKDGYGEWLTLFSLAGYVSISDLGVQVYWLNKLTGAHVRQELEAYRRLFRNGLFLFALVGSTVFVIGLVFALLSGPSRLLELHTIQPSVGSAVLVLLIGSTLITMLSQMVRGVFRTVGQNPKVVAFELSRESLSLVFVTLALLLGFGPAGISATYLTLSVGLLVFVVLTVRRRFPELLDLQIRRADRDTVFKLIRGGSIRIVAVLAVLLLIQGTLLLTNWAMGAAAVAMVATSRTLTLVVHQIARSIYTSTLPEFSRLRAARDKVAMTRLLHKSTSFISAATGMVCIVLIGVGPGFYGLWTGNRFPDAVVLIYVFTASAFVDTCRFSLSHFLDGCNRIALTSKSEILYSLVSLWIMWLLFESLGVLAVPVATAICGSTIFVPIVAVGGAKELDRAAIVSLLLKMAMSGIIITLIAAPLIVLEMSGVSFLVMLLATMAALAIFGALVYRFMLDRADILRIKKYLMTLTTRRDPK